MSKTTLELNPNFSPFHRAVSLYESKQHREAFELFLLLSEKGNLAAHFYLEDILTAENNPQNALILKELTERISFTPKTSGANYWLKASKLIQILKNTDAEIKPKHKKNLMAQLKSLLPIAANAALFLLENNEFEKDKSFSEQIINCCDVSLICHLKLKAKLPASLEKEWALMEKFSNLASPPKGSKIPNQLAILETMLYRTTELQVRKRHWLQQAALLGCKDLQLFCAIHTNAQEKNQWLESAAISGDVEAQMKVALNYFYGQDNFKVDKNKTKKYLDAVLKNPKSEKNINLYFESILAMGYLYAEGEGGVEKNEATTFEYFNKAATYGRKNKLDVKRTSLLSNVLFKLGYFYEHGLGNVACNHKMAAECYENSLKILTPDMDVPKNLIHKRLATLYGAGNHQLPKDRNLAFSHIKFAAFGHDLEAAMKLFDSFFIRKEKVLSLPELERLLALHESHYPKVLTYYGIYYLRYAMPVDNKKAYNYFLQGATDKREIQTDSLVMLAQMHNDNIPELPIVPSPKAAYGYLQQAANLKNPIALNNMGDQLVKGIGVTQNFDLAKKCFEEALELKFQYANTNLANLYHHGLGVAKDFKQAFKYLIASETLNDTNVFFCLGMYYQLGLMGEQNLDKACYYHEKAVALGDPRSAHNYARISLFQMLSENEIDISIMKDIQEKLKFTLSLDFNASENAPLYCLITLLICPKETKESIEILNEQLQITPSDLSALLLNHLKTANALSEEFLLNLLICNITNTVPLNPNHSIPPKNKEDKISSEIINTPASPAAALALSPPTLTPVVNEPSPKAIKPSPKVLKKEKLAAKLSEFFDFKNKDVNLKTFNQILGTMINTFDISYKIKSSKGSNVSYRLEHPDFSQALCFSYHPTHTSGKGFDSEFDPNRASSLRHFIKTVASELKVEVKK